MTEETAEQRLNRLIPIDSTFKGRNFNATVVSVGRSGPTGDSWAVVLVDEDDGAKHFLYFDTEGETLPFAAGSRWWCGYNKYVTLNYTVPPSSYMKGVRES